MPTRLDQKSTVAEIRRRFDQDVERFSNLETGQAATVDAPVVMELITRAAARTTPALRRVLDIGCGAGNNTIRLLQEVAGFDCDLVDLSRPMLERARQRISRLPVGEIRLFQGDFRSVELPEQGYDVVLAAAVLHHLRDDQDWQAAFARLYRVTAPGGSVWITDLVSHETGPVQELMWDRYGDYLRDLGGEAYREKVFAYIDREDSPRSVVYQLELLRTAGFDQVELLHKNSCFAAFGACKAG